MVWAASIQALANAALIRAVEGASGTPRLRYLAVRCNDRPIDLLPAFRPTQAVYRAELDFAESGFAVDAVPAEGFEFANVDEFSSTRLVAPGAQVISTLKVRGPDSKDGLDYSVTIQRLTGEETELRSLNLPGADAQPAFEGQTQDYSVLMPAEMDRLHVEAVLLDSGQTLEATAHPGKKEPKWHLTTPRPLWDPSWEDKLRRPEASDTSGLEPRREVVAKDALNDKGRRLLASGEAQHGVVRRSFPVEVNGSRLVQLRVFAANRNASLHRTYRLQAFRAPCPPQRPFYAPDVQLCAMTCNDGYFPRHATSRCEACPEHCRRCSSYERCEVCEPSQWQTLHFLQRASGRCHVLRIHWHLLLLGGLGALSAFVLCTCICFACCHGSSRRPRSRKPGRKEKLAPEDPDGEQSQRLLDANRFGGGSRGFSDDD